jgi:hypothetical protein
MGRVVLIAIASFAAVSPTAAQTLEGMRSEILEDKKREESSHRKHPKVQPDFLTAGYDDDEEGFFEGLSKTVVTSPFWMPRLALADDGGPGYFPKHPYGKQSGSLLFDEAHTGAHSSLLALQGDYGSDFDSLSQGHVRIFGERDSRIGFDTEFFYRKEQLRPGTDELWHGDFNLTYRFAQNEHWQFRAGLGVNWLTDDRDSNLGFNATYGAEWFPVKPWVLNSSLDWGRIGSTSLLHLRNTVGVTKSGWGVFTGHDYLRIGDERIHAWVNGVEYRF